MAGLLRHLWSAAKEWRGERRDFELMKVFLESPQRREKIIELASPSARFFMLVLWQFAESDLESTEVQLINTISLPTGGVSSLPHPMGIHWIRLLLSPIYSEENENAPGGLTYVTTKGPVSIYVEKTDWLDKPYDMATFEKAMADYPETYIFSKKPLDQWANSTNGIQQ
jgi:hypothetical protein